MDRETVSDSQEEEAEEGEGAMEEPVDRVPGLPPERRGAERAEEPRAGVAPEGPFSRALAKARSKYVREPVDYSHLLRKRP